MNLLQAKTRRKAFWCPHEFVLSGFGAIMDDPAVQIISSSLPLCMHQHVLNVHSQRLPAIYTPFSGTRFTAYIPY
jgi:hypothetical protein